MSDKKWLYPLINILLYAIGFPVLFIIALVKSIEWNSYGMYGASAFAPLIAVIILAAIVLGVQALVYNLCIKKGKTGRTLLVKMAIIPLAVIVGIFGILDVAMPPLLKDATSNTILYQDVVYDYQGMHEKLYERVELFKEKNGMDKSVKFTDKEFHDVFDPLFKSMDQAYHAFDPLAIEIALDKPDMLAAISSGDFPIELAATLLLTTSFEENANNHNLTLKEIIDMNLDTIIKTVGSVLGDAMSGDLDLSDTAQLNKIVNSILVYKEFDGIRWNIFNILGSNMLFADIDPNAEIVKVIYDEYGYEDGTEYMGAALGYQDMSWLNGIPMMFFIPLMSVREIFYIFAAILVLCVVVQYFVADAYAKKFNCPFSFIMLKRNK